MHCARLSVPYHRADAPLTPLRLARCRWWLGPEREHIGSRYKYLGAVLHYLATRTYMLLAAIGAPMQPKRSPYIPVVWRALPLPRIATANARLLYRP
jgi:hypothetical protein